MLPSLASVLETQTFLARRFGLDPRCDPKRITEALHEAAELAQDREIDEPAALLFALTRRPRALGALWLRAPLVLATNQARRLGFHLACDPGDVELENLRLAIIARRATFEDVRTWVAACLRPMR